MKIKLSKSQWQFIGKQAGWMKKANEVIVDSGIKGWQDKLQNVYNSLNELIAYDEIYNICKRLGYDSPEECWNDNPTVQGSVKPSDFKKIK